MSSASSVSVVTELLLTVVLLDATRHPAAPTRAGPPYQRASHQLCRAGRSLYPPDDAWVVVNDRRVVQHESAESGEGYEPVERAAGELPVHVPVTRVDLGGLWHEDGAMVGALVLMIP